MADAPKLKPQKVVEILDASFRLYRENFVTFLGILAGAHVPIILLSMGLMAMVTDGSGAPAAAPGEHPSSVQMKAHLAGFVTVSLVTAFLSMLAFSLATGALTRAVGSRYLNEPASIGACYRHILGILMKYIGTNLLYGLVVGLGMLLLVIPGIIFAIWFIFTSSVVVLEGLGGTAAMGRSRQLARDNAGRIMGLGVLTFLINLVFTKGIQAASSHLFPKLTDNPLWVGLLTQSSQQLAWMVFSPIFSVAWILLYYDIRIRKEAFDLEVLAKNMARRGGPTP